MRRVLVVAYDFPPIASASAQRNRQLVRHLPAFGWRPTVVTPTAGTSWARDPGTVADVPPDIEVQRTGSIEPKRLLRRHRADHPGTGAQSEPSALLRRLREWILVPDARAGWIPFATPEVLRRLPETDVLLTTDPVSDHVAGGLARAVVRRPWVADFHDPWSLPSYQPWAGRWRPWVDARLERWVLRTADRVVAPTGWLMDHLAQRGAGDRIRLVPNGFDPDEYPAAVRRDGAFTLLHAGCFYGPRSPEPLLAAVAAALEREPEMRAHVRLRLRDWHDGENAARLAVGARRFGLDDVIERVAEAPRQEAMAAMRSAAVLVAATDSVEGGWGLVPLKVYEYLGAGRPVLALCPPEGETGRLVRAAGGFVVDPSDDSAAATALCRLYERWRSGDGDIGFDASLVEAHRWDRLAGRLAAVLEEAVREGRP